MMPFNGLAAGVLGACLFALMAPARADFVGDNVTVNYEWPDLGAVLYPGGTSLVVPAGTTFDLTTGGVTADVTDSNILVTFPGGWDFSTAPKTFDGLVITDPTADITGVSLASTNIAGFVASDLSFDSHDVDVNFPYPPFSSLSAGATVSVDVQFASAVPEPTLAVLLSAGLLGIGLFRRRLLKVS